MSSSSSASASREGSGGKLHLKIALAASGLALVLYVAFLRGSSAERYVDPGTFPELRIFPIVDKPQADPRLYTYAEFPSGLRAVAVQDPSATRSAYSVSVRAGSYHEPRELPGLAHFCEHMLFLGTGKYPSPTGFDEFMAANGGRNNAFTAPELTDYFATVTSDAGPEALRRLADFFRAPLFNKTFVEKEVHAIQSEHDKNVQDPIARVLRVLYSLASRDSPLSRFHTGNVDTLYNWPAGNGTSPVDALKVYFENHYCASKMQVASFGPGLLAEQLKDLQEAFGDLSAGNEECAKEDASFAEPDPWPPSSLGGFVSVRGIEPEAALWLLFPLEDTTGSYPAQPLRYLRYILDYGGEGSLSRVLQQLGLAAALRFLSDSDSAGSRALVSVRLTEQGRAQPELVLDLLFAYLGELRRSGVDAELYASLAQVARLQWDWSEPSKPMELVSRLSERLTRLRWSELLSGDERIDAPEPELVRRLLEGLDPGNMNVALVAQEQEAQSFQTLPYYGVEYAVEALEARFPGALERWGRWLSRGHGAQATRAATELGARLLAAGLLDQAGAEAFELPRPPRAIVGVPELDLVGMRAQASPELYGPEPRLASRAFRERSRLVALEHGGPDAWFRPGWVTTSPSVQLRLLLRPLRAEAQEPSALDAARLRLYGDLLGKELGPRTADLTAAGQSYDVSPGPGGLRISFSGLAPLLPGLIHSVLSCMEGLSNGSIQVEEPRFARLLAEYREELLVHDGMPVSYALRDGDLLLSRGTHGDEELLAALPGVTQQGALAAAEGLLSQPLKLTSLVMGNLDRAAAEEMLAGVLRGLRLPKAAVEAPEAAVEAPAVVRLSAPAEARLPNPRGGDENHVAVVSLLGKETSVEGRVLSAVLGKIVQSVAYSHLRTELQLGYVVSGGVAPLSNVERLTVLVQGAAKDADAQEAAIEHVLATLLPEKLEGLSDDEFRSHRQAFVQELRTPPSGPSEELSHFWTPIANGGRCFDLRAQLLAYAETTLSKERLAEHYANFMRVGPEGTRRKLAVKYFAGQAAPRPSLLELQRLWQAQGVPDSHRGVLEREYHRALVLNESSSTGRARLAKAGGYHSTAVGCEPRREALVDTGAPSAVAGSGLAPWMAGTIAASACALALGRAGARPGPAHGAAPDSEVELMPGVQPPIQGESHGSHAHLQP